MSNKWQPDSNPHQARRIGKTAEEVSELGAVLARISIQGLDQIDPASGKSNRTRLHEESADVLAQIRCNVDSFQMDIDFIERRAAEKAKRMAEWEAHFGVVIHSPIDPLTLHAAASALVHQIEINNFEDSHGHYAKNLQAFRDLSALLQGGEPMHRQLADLKNHECSTAAIVYALSVEDGGDFLRYWNEGDFDACRMNWPDAPTSCYPVLSIPPGPVLYEIPSVTVDKQPLNVTHIMGHAEWCTFNSNHALCNCRSASS